MQPVTRIHLPCACFGHRAVLRTRRLLHIPRARPSVAKLHLVIKGLGRRATAPGHERLREASILKQSMAGWPASGASGLASFGRKIE